jgi:predicted ATPase
MITSVRVQNFKSWRDSGEITLKSLTGIFGTNSSGKSSLHQMLLLLKQTKNYSDRRIPLRTEWENDAYINLGTVRELVHADADSLTLSVAWKSERLVEVAGGKQSDLQLDTTISVADGRPTVTEFQYSAHNFLARMWREGKQYKLHVTQNGKQPARPQVRPVTFIGTPEKCYRFSSEALGAYVDSGYLNDVVLSFERALDQIYHLGPLRAYPERRYIWGEETPDDVGTRGENTVPMLLAHRATRVYKGNKGEGILIKAETRIAEWLIRMRLVESFRTERISDSLPDYRVLVRRRKDSPEVPITDVGFGVSQILPVLVLCYTVPFGSTLILEQPEIHLHPSVQAVLADVFIDVICRRGLQIIVESHSEHLLRRIQRRIAENTMNAGDTALYFCDTDAHGVSYADKLQFDDFGQITNWPKDFFGDLMGDVISTLDAGLSHK